MGADRKFVFATKSPQRGVQAWVCECHCVSIYPDGRADLFVLPTLRCRVQRGGQASLDSLQAYLASVISDDVAAQSEGQRG